MLAASGLRLRRVWTALRDLGPREYTPAESSAWVVVSPPPDREAQPVFGFGWLHNTYLILDHN